MRVCTDDGNREFGRMTGFRKRITSWDEQILLVWATIFGVVVLSGCNLNSPDSYTFVNDGSGYRPSVMQVDYPDVRREYDPEIAESLPPRSIADRPPAEFWELSLEECISIALGNSAILRDLGGRILTQPDSVGTIYEPSIRHSDPLFGPEGALSAFDTQLTTTMFWSRNDRAFNNRTAGGGNFQVMQDLGDFDFQLQKVTTSGTQFNLSVQTDYDQNNQVANNRFNSAWDQVFEFNVTQPLLRGAGATYTRILGPNATPGSSGTTGVLLARINTDITLTDFEAGVRNALSDLENTYWNLYSLYRALDGSVAGRDRALITWKSVHAKFQTDKQGGEADKEAAAREQYYRFQSAVWDALESVYNGERQLRRLMGLPVNDGRLIRPSDDPPEAETHYDWGEARGEALTRRAELRRQMWTIKRRELELLGARNFLLPQLDLVALYRFRGLGDQLVGNRAGPFGSSFGDLGSGDHQEWQFGIQFDVPIGFRQEIAAVRQATLQLARDRAVLKEQERQLLHDLANELTDLIRTQVQVKNNYNRLVAASRRLKAAEVALDHGKETVRLEDVLLAQERLVDATAQYFSARTQHAVAIKDVHLQKGTLLEYNGVFLSEGPWPDKAYADAQVLQSRLVPKAMDYRMHYPLPISSGTVSTGPLINTNQPRDAQPPNNEPLPVPAPPEAPREGPVTDRSIPSDFLPVDGWDR